MLTTRFFVGVKFIFGLGAVSGLGPTGTASDPGSLWSGTGRLCPDRTSARPVGSLLGGSSLGGNSLGDNPPAWRRGLLEKTTFVLFEG